MKTLALTIAATAAMGLTLIGPADAEAGQVHVSISLGIPAVVYYPSAVYHPAVAYRAPVIYGPVPYYRRHYRAGYDRHHDFDRHVGRATAYYRGFARSRVIEEVRIDPRLRR